MRLSEMAVQGQLGGLAETRVGALLRAELEDRAMFAAGCAQGLVKFRKAQPQGLLFGRRWLDRLGHAGSS